MKIEEVRNIGVLGCGAMGGGIVQVCATFGYGVVARDISEDALEKAKKNVVEGRFGLKRGLDAGKITREQYESAIKNIKFTTSMDEFCADPDVVIECVFEDLPLKMRMFRQMDELCPPKTIFASNTSGFSITALGSATNRPDRVAGMHWFNPAVVMKLVEVVKADATSEETINCVRDLAVKLGKVPIVIKDSPRDYGFIANRAYFAMLRECEAIVAAGIATEEQVDTALKLGYALPMGPFELMKFVRMRR